MKKRKLVLFGLGMLILGALVLGVARIKLKRHLESVGCIHQMSSIGVAAGLYANDNTNSLPHDFVSMSNELSIPMILVCPSDHLRQVATNWSSFTPANCSYLIINTGFRENFRSTPFLRCPIHGHVGCADGTVLSAEDPTRFRKILKDSTGDSRARQKQGNNSLP